MLRLLVTSVLFASVPSAALGVTVSGHVTDENGIGIFNVDLDFFNRDTGQLEFTPFDNTDANGFYSVDVPVAEYDITFNANDDTYLDVEIRTDIDGPTTVDQTLPFAELMIGRVESELGVGLSTVDLNFFETGTGTAWEANNDNTDALGNFGILVPGWTFDVFFTAPAGQPYAGAALYGVTVADTTDVGTIVLPDGKLVTASLLAPGGGSAGAMDSDFTDVTTGDVIYTPRDDSDGLGALSVYVPTGTYDVTLKPQAGTGWAWKTVPNVAATAPTNALGNVSLEVGHAVTGLVRDGAMNPVALADLDMVDPVSGKDLPTADDNTNAAGAFSLFPPTSTFDLQVKPPSGSSLAAAVLRDVSIASATNLGTITLPDGITISGTVHDVYGAPVPDTNIEVYELATNDAFPAIDSRADVAGDYSIQLPTGGWILVARPPVGSGWLTSISVVSSHTMPTQVNFTLPSSTVDAPVVVPLAGPHLRATPNPFHGSTSLEWSRRSTKPATLRIFDAAGRMVRDFSLGREISGRVVWDGRDANGVGVASGVYFYRLQSADDVSTRKVVRLR